jgi:hypothetical protein
MLRLTATVVQVLSDAHIIVSVHQEDPYDGPNMPLGEARHVYSLGSLLDSVDEVTALVTVLGWWADDVAKSTYR